MVSQMALGPDPVRSPGLHPLPCQLGPRVVVSSEIYLPRAPQSPFVSSLDVSSVPLDEKLNKSWVPEKPCFQANPRLPRFLPRWFPSWEVSVNSKP